MSRKKLINLSKKRTKGKIKIVLSNGIIYELLNLYFAPPTIKSMIKDQPVEKKKFILGLVNNQDDPNNYKITRHGGMIIVIDKKVNIDETW